MEDDSRRRSAARRIDLGQLERLAQIHCTLEEAAAVLDLGRDELAARLEQPAVRAAWERGRARGRASLRRLQWLQASGERRGAVQMTLHLSRQWLAEDKRAAPAKETAAGRPEPSEARLDLSRLSDAQLESLEDLLALAEGGPAGAR